MTKRLTYLLAAGFALGSPAAAQTLPGLGAPAVSGPAQASPAPLQFMPSFADLVEQLQPVVVNISTTHRSDEAEGADEALGVVSPNPQIQEYFAPQNPQQLSLGSGFIVDEEGFIVTNHHVIDKAEAISVTLADERQLEARVVGSDAKTDLALIKVNTAEKLPAAKLGDSDKIRVGDWVVAIGNPFGLGGSVTAGIVSAKSRDIEAGSYDNFIQTDASINQGSSGGPMFNTQGEVIGINSAIYSTTGGSMGIGFAAPVNLAKFVIRELKEKGKVERGWLGIKMQPNTAEIAKSVGQDTAVGVVVTSVSENSPARKAGIEAGDIIVSLNGVEIDDAKTFSRQIAETAAATDIELELWRNKRLISKKLAVELMPEAVRPPAPAPQAAATAETTADIRFATVTPELIEKYQLEADSRGVVVTEVRPGSDAEIKGIKSGDLITEIDKKAVLDINDAQATVDDARRENNRPVLFLINNHNIPHYAAVKL